MVIYQACNVLARGQADDAVAIPMVDQLSQGLENIGVWDLGDGHDPCAHSLSGAAVCFSAGHHGRQPLSGRADAGIHSCL